MFKHTRHGPLVTKRPDMSRVKWSPAQRAQRQLMQKAARHYREAMLNPKQAAQYRAVAAKQKIPVSSLVMGEYLKNAKKSAGV